MVSEPIKTIPQGLPLLDTNCDTWARSCGKGIKSLLNCFRQNIGSVLTLLSLYCRLADCETWSVEKESKCKYKKDRGARIVGGEDAKLEDAPWDIILRYIYDWGGTLGSPSKFTAAENATNNVSRIKEQGRCTGIFYTKNVVITSATCGIRGYFFALTRNRFVGWLARQRFLVQNWCMYKSDVNPKQTCDITVHPEFGSSNSSNLEAMMQRLNNDNAKAIIRSEHDISIVKFYTAFDFKSYPHTRAIPFAQPGMEFEGNAFYSI